MNHLRLITLLCAMPAALASFLPGARDALVLDRAALAAGEWWRAWTGHWVHFSAAHLAWNLLVVSLAAAWWECARPGVLIRHLALAAPALSLAVLALDPAATAYGGLSGLACGLVTWLALDGAGRASRERWFWRGVLVLLAAKLAFDATHAVAVFVTFDPDEVRASPVAHLAGSALAVVHWASEHALSRINPRLIPRPLSTSPCPPRPSSISTPT